MLESQVKRHKSAQRRAADSGVLRSGKRPIFAFHKRLHFLDEKFCVTISAPAAQHWHIRERIFADSRFRVVRADDDDRLDGASVDALVARLLDVPAWPQDV